MSPPRSSPYPTARPSARSAPADLPCRLVEPRRHAPLPVLVEVGLQNHAIPAGRHGCLRPRGRGGRRLRLRAPGHRPKPARPGPGPAPSTVVKTTLHGRTGGRAEPMAADGAGWTPMAAQGHTHLLRRGTAERKKNNVAKHLGVVEDPANQERRSALTNQIRGGRK